MCWCQVAYHSETAVHEEHHVGAVEHEAGVDVGILRRGGVGDGLGDEAREVGREGCRHGGPAAKLWKNSGSSGIRPGGLADWSPEISDFQIASVVCRPRKAAASVSAEIRPLMRAG